MCPAGHLPPAADRTDRENRFSESRLNTGSLAAFTYTDELSGWFFPFAEKLFSASRPQPVSYRTGIGNTFYFTSWKKHGKTEKTAMIIITG